MNKSFYYAGAAVVLLVAGLFILKPSGTTTNNTTNNNATSSAQTAPVTSNEDKFTVTIKDGKNASGPQTYTSTEGRTVRFVITSNVGGKFHVHGYTNLEKMPLVIGQSVEMVFTADKTGRFDLEFHSESDEETILGALEVTPK